MKHFTIDSENNITAHNSKKAARETGAGVFSTARQRFIAGAMKKFFAV